LESTHGTTISSDIAATDHYASIVHYLKPWSQGWTETMESRDWG